MTALFIASWGPSNGNLGIGDGLRCALPAEQSAMCNASLLFMLEHSTKFTAKADAEVGLRQFLAVHS